MWGMLERTGNAGCAGTGNSRTRIGLPAPDVRVDTTQCGQRHQTPISSGQEAVCPANLAARQTILGIIVNFPLVALRAALSGIAMMVHVGGIAPMVVPANSVRTASNQMKTTRRALHVPQPKQGDLQTSNEMNPAPATPVPMACSQMSRQRCARSAQWDLLAQVAPARCAHQEHDRNWAEMGCQQNVSAARGT